MQKELKKMLYAKIIFQVGHSAWVENLELINKMIGEIFHCVSFHNLNKEYKKYELPHPSNGKTPTNCF